MFFRQGHKGQHCQTLPTRSNDGMIFCLKNRRPDLWRDKTRARPRNTTTRQVDKYASNTALSSSQKLVDQLHARTQEKHVSQTSSGKLQKIRPLDFVELLPKQEQFCNDKAKTKGAFGSNRGGKTFLGAYYIIQKCLEKPKQRWWAVAETEEISVSVQQRKIWELIPKDQIRYGHYDAINGFRNGKVVFTDGSLVRFKTYKQGREAFASDDLDGIWNDEEPPMEIYREQRMRLIDRNGEMVFTMTSLKGMTDLMTEVYDEHQVIESQYAKLYGEELPRIVEKDGMKFYTLWSEENQHIDRARLVEEAKLMTRDEIKSRIYGVPVNLSGKIYPKFNKDIHGIETKDIPKLKVSLVHVLDPHDRKPWAMQWWAVHVTGKAYCVYEYPFGRNFNEVEFDDKTYDDYVKIIKSVELDLMRWFGRRVSRRIIDPNFGNCTVQLQERKDGQSNTTCVKELRRRGLIFRDGIDRPMETGHLQVRKWLHWVARDGEIVVQPKMYISTDCENTIRHLSRHSRKDILTGDGDVKDKVGVKEKYKDYCFAAGTMIRTPNGQVAIESIEEGDIVETDIGPRKVIASNITGINRPTVKAIFSDGRTLIATSNHSVYLKNGLKISLDNIRYGDIMSEWLDRKHMTGKLDEAVTSNLDQDSSTEKYGKNTTAKFLNGIKSTIRMRINSITKYLILTFSRLRHTENCTQDQKMKQKSYPKLCEKGRRDRTKWSRGIEARLADSKHRCISKETGLSENPKQEYVSNVEIALKPRSDLRTNSVPITASPRTGEARSTTMCLERVSSAMKPTKLINTQNQKHVQENVLEFLRVEPSSPRTVYNLTVEGRHRYYANDILVSNCDTTRYFAMSNPVYVPRTTKKVVEQGRMY